MSMMFWSPVSISVSWSPSRGRSSRIFSTSIFCTRSIGAGNVKPMPGPKRVAVAAEAGDHAALFRRDAVHGGEHQPQQASKPTIAHMKKLSGWGRTPTPPPPPPLPPKRAAALAQELVERGDIAEDRALGTAPARRLVPRPAALARRLVAGAARRRRSGPTDPSCQQTERARALPTPEKCSCPYL